LDQPMVKNILGKDAHERSRLLQLTTVLFCILALAVAIVPLWPASAGQPLPDMAAAGVADAAACVVERGDSNVPCHDQMGAGASLKETPWPEQFQPIRRVPFQSIEELLGLMKPQSKDGQPVIIEGTNVMDASKWADIDHLQGLLQDQEVVVKRSPCSKFRYFDMTKNVGQYTFRAPIEERKQTLKEFMLEAEEILTEGRPERLYMQETLSGHAEMAEEFASWAWELLIRVSQACGWGLPDSNELFVGMSGAETPLHFDERENLFFQVRGRKEIVVFPFIDYLRLYPFPTTHPCDRQSMVGSPVSPDLEAFPRFQGIVGHYATLKAGDLLYLPYGWWHWLRNLENLTMSVSFWSTTPSNNLSGIPSTFTPHMLTRVRRNLESMLAQQHGPEHHDATMLELRQAILEGNNSDPRLAMARQLLTAVRIDEAEQQDAFLFEMIEGRFGIDWNKHVEG